MNDRVISVLDHGHVRLIDSMGNDLSVVRAARISHDAAWRAGENEGSDEKLIRYLMNNRHSTPFEHVTFTFDVKAPIFVFRQWHRHRTQSYNEQSARYTKLADEYYSPKPEHIGTQSSTNKQGRSVEMTEEDKKTRELQVILYEGACDEAFELYEDLLEAGWPRELARCVLPMSTYSQMFATMNLWNLLHFLGLRLHAHAQYEIRVYAEAMLQLIEPLVPVSIAAWRNK